MRALKTKEELRKKRKMFLKKQIRFIARVHKGSKKHKEIKRMYEIASVPIYVFDKNGKYVATSNERLITLWIQKSN